MTLKKPTQGKSLARTSERPESGKALPVAGVSAPEEPEGGLDRFDIAILAALQSDARMSNLELASQIGLSPAPTWRRVRRLETQGYITGYRADLDRRKIGLGVLAFVRVDAERNTGRATRALEDALRKLPEVIACHYISGTGTFELQVMATDLDAFSRFSLETLLNLPHVKDIHTSFSLGEVKSAGALPLSHLLSGSRGAGRTPAQWPTASGAR
jgi:DNA-binding Lrp family transcriptional regulator